MIQTVSSAEANVPVRLPASQPHEPTRQAKLEAVHDMLAALETATIPGLHYVMDRIIGLLGQEVVRASGHMTGWQRQSVAAALHELGREAAHLVPDESAFRARAEILTDVLQLAR
jgi:hypothetical protein